MEAHSMAMTMTMSMTIAKISRSVASNDKGNEK